jgi:hypothetical protein
LLSLQRALVNLCTIWCSSSSLLLERRSRNLLGTFLGLI